MSTRYPVWLHGKHGAALGHDPGNGGLLLFRGCNRRFGDDNAAVVWPVAARLDVSRSPQSTIARCCLSMLGAAARRLVGHRGNI